MSKLDSLKQLLALKQLDAERIKLIEEAKKHTLGEIQEHINVLAQLGFNYELVDRGMVKKRRKRRKVGTE